jgi:Carboxypeptidase regulatory-like domain/TonB-dependent Receptor Plug Domain/TonB dependent receptor-like, beta-barrel
MRLLIVLVVSLVTLVSAAFAQITSATVSGTIKDETGGVLPGVDVVITNVGTGLTRSAVTDTNGYFTVPGLAPGTYEARASVQGFRTAVQSGIVLEVAQQAALDLVLKLGAASETVTVSGESPLIDLRTSALSAVVPEKTIEELPLNGRNFISLATLQPGVVQFTERLPSGSSTKGVQLNINGMGGRSNSYLLDGANMRNFAGVASVTAADSTLGVETIREFRVVTNAFSADYGRVMGGIINIATKSGTNALHGSGFEFFRNSRMDARNFFDPGEPPPFTRHQYGGAVGGPIVKNRVFFFGGYERLQEDLGQTVITAVPTAAVRTGVVNPAVRPYLDLYPLPNGPSLGPDIAQYTYAFTRTTRENFLQGRVDVQLSHKDLLFVRHTSDRTHQVFPGAGALASSLYPQFFTIGSSNNQLFTVEETRTFSEHLFNSVRFSRSDLFYGQVPGYNLTQPLPFFPEAGVVGTIDVGGLSRMGTDPTSPVTQPMKYSTWNDDLTSARGKHVLKSGVLIEHGYSDRLSSLNNRGNYTFANIAQFLAGVPSRFQGVAPGAKLNRQRSSTLFGFYVQDDYRVTPSLTLNLGARYEVYTVPKEKNGLDAYLPDLLTSTDTVLGGPFVNPSKRNLAPRVGFAWDLTGDGRTAVRGGTGIYYDTDNPFNSSLGISAFTPPFAPAVTVSGPGIRFPNPSFEPSPGARTLRTVDYHVKQPRGWTYNVNLQRDLAGHWAVMVGYAGSRGYNLIQTYEGNPVVPTKLADGTLFFPANAPRRNPAWSTIDWRASSGHSAYNALQSTLMKRFNGGHQLQVSYTLSRAMDNNDSQLPPDTQSNSIYPANPYDLESEWAVSSFDTPQVFVANATYELPGSSRHAVLGGWQVNGIVSLRSGYPFTPSLATPNWSRSGNIQGTAEDRPSVKPGTDPKKIITGNPDHWFDTSAFFLQPPGFLGTTPRNFLRGPGFANTDLSLVKNQALGGGTRLQLRLEVFNVFNRANFAVPTRAVFAAAAQDEAPLPSAGKVTRTVNSSRQVQLGVKLLF